MALGIGVLVSNAVAAGWGAVGWLRKDATASIVFWPLLRVAQALVVVQVLVGLLLLARGATAPDGLHVAYGVGPLVITLVSEAMRAAVLVPGIGRRSWLHPYATSSQTSFEAKP